MTVVKGAERSSDVEKWKQEAVEGGEKRETKVRSNRRRGKKNKEG